MCGKMNIRFAGKEDLEQINRLRKQVNDLHVEGRPDIFKPGFCEEFRRHAENYLEWENNNIIVADEDGQILGMVMVDYIEKPESPHAYARRFLHIAEICVDRDARRKGVASALLEFVKQDAKARDFDRIELDVWAFNDALAFYEASGFRTYRRFMEYEL